MIRIFTYEVHYTDELTHEVLVQCGIVHGTSCSDAVKNLEDYYGSEYIFTIENFVELDDYPIVLPKNVVKKVLNDDYCELNEKEI